MASYSELTIVGHVGKDVEMRYAPSGQAVTNFSVAESRKFKTGSGEDVEYTVWYRIVAWGKLGEVCKEYLEKGMQVLVIGQLEPDRATGSPKIFSRQNGESGASYEVRANKVLFLGKGNGQSKQSNQDEGAEIPDEDSIPF